MTWLKYDDRWCRRPDILALSDGAYRLHTCAMLHTMEHATDGVLSRRIVPMLSPTFDRRHVTELIRAGLWRTHPDGWFITDPLMLEQPTRAEVEAQRDADTARVALFRARKADPRDPAAISACEAEDARAKESLRLAKADRERVRACSPGVTVGVTPNVTANVTPNVQRPDPTRPDPETLRVSPGSGVGPALPDAPSAPLGDGAVEEPPAPVRSLAELGVLPPPGHRSNGRKPPADEEVAQQHVRVLSDPKAGPELRRIAESSLRAMGMADLIPVTTG